MNHKMVRYVLGVMLAFEAVFFLVPMLTALYFSEWESLKATLISAGLCLLAAIPMSYKKPKNTKLYAKEGFVIVSLSWILLSAFGALPLVFSGAIPNYIDAFFEIVSGFTTTGSSVIPAVEEIPKAMLIWRSFSNWIGGMGVLVFVMAIMPLSGAQNMHIMRAESPGPEVSKLVPRVRRTAIILYLIYIAITAIMFIFLSFDKSITTFEAINSSLATAGTGGFGFRNDSFYSISPYVQWVVAIFMLIFSVNFNSYYLILKKKFKDAFNTEVLVFLGIVAVAITLVTIDVSLNNSFVRADGETMVSPSGEPMNASFGETVRHAVFTVSTIISTCGFSTVDYNVWPALSHLILFVLMITGACAGSTAGGFKISRIVIVFKSMIREFGNLIHPNRVKKITIDKKPVSDEAVRSVLTYLATYVFIFLGSLFLLSIDQAIFNPGENTFITNLSAVACTFNNIGPGFDFVGPAQNFADFSPISKLILSFDMLAGRLELFPMLILFTPSTWKK